MLGLEEDAYRATAHLGDHIAGVAMSVLHLLQPQEPSRSPWSSALENRPELRRLVGHGGRSAFYASYLVNFRVLVDFLVRSPGGRDFSRHDYLPGWDPTPGPRVDRLKQQWLYASRASAHLSRDRIGEDWPDVVRVNIWQASRDIASVFSDFVEELKAREHPWVQRFQPWSVALQQMVDMIEEWRLEDPQDWRRKVD